MIHQILRLSIVCACLPMLGHAANLNISYYHAPTAQLVWSEDTGSATESSSGTSADGRYKHLTLSLRSNIDHGYEVAVDVKRLGKTSSAAPRVAIETLKQGQTVQSSHLDGSSEEPLAMKFTGSAFKRTRSTDSTPDQVRLTVDTGGSSMRSSGSGLDVVTLTVSTN